MASDLHKLVAQTKVDASKARSERAPRGEGGERELYTAAFAKLHNTWRVSEEPLQCSLDWQRLVAQTRVDASKARGQRAPRSRRGERELYFVAFDQPNNT